MNGRLRGPNTEKGRGGTAGTGGTESPAVTDRARAIRADAKLSGASPSAMAWPRVPINRSRP